MPEIEQFLRLGGGISKAVKDGPQATREGLQNIQRIIPCTALVDDDIEPEIGCEFQLRFESLGLRGLVSAINDRRLGVAGHRRPVGERRVMVLDALLAYAHFTALFIMAMIAPTGLGMGDVKLGAVTGLYLGWLGWSWLFWGTFIGFTMGALWAVALILLKRAHGSTPLAFGPFLIFGVVVSALLAI